jgi:GTPase Era involved in 16S rRNA processing
VLLQEQHSTDQEYLISSEVSREQVHQRLLEEMYVESGVPVEEIMTAFKEYGLKLELTAADRARFQQERK